MAMWGAHSSHSYLSSRWTRFPAILCSVYSLRNTAILLPLSFKIGADIFHVSPRCYYFSVICTCCVEMQQMFQKGLNSSWGTLTNKLHTSLYSLPLLRLLADFFFSFFPQAGEKQEEFCYSGKNITTIMIVHCTPMVCCVGLDVCLPVLSHIWFFCDLMDCSLPGSSFHRFFQARILEWVALSYSRRSSQPRNRNWVSCVSCIGRQILYHWTSWEALEWLVSQSGFLSVILFDIRSSPKRAEWVLGLLLLWLLWITSP